MLKRNSWMRGKWRKAIAIVMAFCFIFTTVGGAAVTVFADGTKTTPSQMGPVHEASQVNGTVGTAVVPTADSAVSVENGKVVVDKTIAATDEENVFDITLSVKTEDEVINQILEPDAAVVLVFDTSTSMNEKLADGTQRLAAAKTAAQQFINSFVSSNPDVKRKISMVEFYKDAQVILNWTDAADLDTSRSTIYTNAIGNLSYENHSGTNIEGGLLLARNLINNAGSTLDGIEHISVILLSDGGANACVVSSAEKDAYDVNYTGRDLFGYTNSELANNTSFTGFYGNANYHFHHGGAMEAVASLPEGVELNTVFCGNASELLTAHDSAAKGKLIETGCKYCEAAKNAFNRNDTRLDIKVPEFLQDISDTYVTVTNADQLVQEFEKIENNINLHTQAWKVVDPVTNVNFQAFQTVGQTDEFSQANGIINWNLLKAKPVEKNGVYTYSVTYRVKLDTLKADYNAGDYYKTNGPTKLDYYIENSETGRGGIQSVYFNIPSVKGFDADLTFYKVDDKGEALKNAIFTLTTKADPSWTRTATSDENGKVEFKDIPSGQNYTLVEFSAPEGYEKSTVAYEVNVSYGEVTVKGVSDLANFKVENTVEKTSVSVSKVWDDAGDQDGKRPEGITFALLADGQTIETKEVTAKEQWTWTFTNLPKYKNGVEIEYTISEVSVPGYETEITGNAAEGFVVTNSYTPETIKIEGAKTWNDADNQDGVRPESIVIRLWANGKEVASQTVKAENGWKWSFDNLPKNQNGAAIQYTITEDEVTGYKAEVDGYDVTNTHEIETVDVSVFKDWDDANDQDGKRPDEITFTLLADGKSVATKKVTANEQWTWTFTDLPKYKEGAVAQEIQYTIGEVKVDGYSTVITGDAANGFVVTNSYTPGKTSVQVTKAWDDADNQDGIRPAEVTVVLLADGEETGKALTLNEGNNWTGSFTELNEYKSGKKIVYTVQEVEVEGYETEITGDAAKGFVVTNSYAPETVEVSVDKIWDDANDQDGMRPDEITINLYADDTFKESKVVTAENGWKWTFTNLPKYAAGKEITYTIKEEAVTDYTTAVTGDAAQGFVVTNSHTPETVEVAGSKTWVDNDDQDGKRPDEITITLFAGGKEVKSATVTEADGWKWSFNDLPKYAAGKEIKYTIVETKVDGYEASYNGYNVTNTHTPETVEVAGSKTWVDNDDQDGKRPDEITIHLFADGKEIGSVTVTEEDDWAWTFEDLPKYRDQGTKIVYTITEDKVADYTTEVNGYDVTNTHEIEKTEVAGSKTWDDNNNQDGKRPESITINLLANGEEINSVTVTAEDGWAWTFTDLDKFASGKEIKYTITEDKVANYETEVDGYDVTNTHELEKVEVSGVKTWNDNNNQDGKRPASITINLLANGIKVDSKNVSAGQDGAWAYSFINLPKYENGEVIVYTITEETVEGYEVAVRGYNVINTHEIEKTEVAGTKTWNDNNNQDGKRPASITINLLANGIKVDSETVTAEDNWAWAFTNLDKFENGQEITYTITENEVEGYSAVVNGYNVTNSYTPEKTSVSGSKVWADANDQDGIRPDSVTINLLANGTKVDSLTVTANDNWAYSFTNLDKYAAGKEIVYSVTEEAVAGYETSIEGYVVTNTHTPETIDVSGSKTWLDNNDQDGIRPEYIIINLLADGNEVKEMTVTAADGWAWTFEDLPKYRDHGKEIVYTVSEEAVEGYTAAYDGMNVTNTHEIEKTEVSGNKTWDDAENQDGVRPGNITINLLADGEKVVSKIVTANDNWAWTFEDLPKYRDHGTEIVYTITEEAVAGYAAAVNGTNVTNTHVPEVLEISGNKTWNDNDNQDGKRPDNITINLLADGVEIDEAIVTAANGWAWTFEDLPKYRDGGIEIIYTITEETVEGYTTVVDGYNVTNTHEIEKTEVSGSKTWDDNDDQDGIRPDSITINLLADGEVAATKVVTAADEWAWTFENLDVYKAGAPIVYTITEETVEGYETEVDGYDVTNTHVPEELEVSGTKTWVDNDNQDGVRPDSITVRLFADGSEIAVQEVTEAEGWAYSFTALPKYRDGGIEIVYTLTEDAVEDYSTEYDGYNVTNTHTPGKTSVSVTKAWVDAENQDGIRPEAIIAVLVKDGEATETIIELNADNNWTGSFTDLDVYRDGGVAIVYTVEEVAVEGYTTEITGDAEAGYVITNTHEAETTDVEVSKVWDDMGNLDLLRPETITIVLVKNGVATETTITLSAADSWTGAFEGLAKYENGVEIVYTVEEKEVEGYTATISGDAAEGFVIKNLHEVDDDVLGESDAPNTADGMNPFWFLLIAGALTGSFVATAVLRKEEN